MSIQETAAFYLSKRLSANEKWTYYWQTMEAARMKQLINEWLSNGKLEEHTRKKLQQLFSKL